MRNLLCKTSTLTDQQSEAIGQEFIKQHALMVRLINKHIGVYGGNFEELFSRAIDTLIVAYLKHDPIRSDWSKFIYHQLRLGLINVHIERRNKKHGVKTNSDDIFQYIPLDGGCDSSDFLEELRGFLTDDAKFFLDFFLQDTESLNRRDMFRRFRENRLAAKWSRKRIKTACFEVRDILLYMIREG